jgi:hypothetical protein
MFGRLKKDVYSPGLVLSWADWNVSTCAGSRTPALRPYPHVPTPGVGEAPRRANDGRAAARKRGVQWVASPN